MTLTGKQIQSLGIVKNLDNPKCIQQQGIDVELIGVSRQSSYNEGKIFLDHTELPKFVGLDSVIDKETGKRVWILSPGWYEATLKQGCDMMHCYKGGFKTRSSLVRCGAVVFSGQYDAGFHTDNMGCFIMVTSQIKIEVGARIAQFVVEKTDNVENAYDGQWQNDKQRNESTK